MKQKISHLRKNISRPNGRKAIARIRADISTLIYRAPPAYVSSWIMDAESAAFKLFSLLDRIYEDRR